MKRSHTRMYVSHACTIIARLDNQKKLFIADQSALDKQRKEEEAAKEAIKEQEISHYEKLGELAARDPRSSTLKFMYAVPTTKDDSKDTTSLASAPNAVAGDDDMVKSFRERMDKKLRVPYALEVSTDLDTMEAAMEAASYSGSRKDDSQRIHKLKRDPNFAASAKQSKLEKETGRRFNPGLTQAEQVSPSLTLFLSLLCVCLKVKKKSLKFNVGGTLSISEGCTDGGRVLVECETQSQAIQ